MCSSSTEVTPVRSGRSGPVVDRSNPGAVKTRCGGDGAVEKRSNPGAVGPRVQLDPVAVTRIGANWPVGEVTMRDDGSAEPPRRLRGFERLIHTAHKLVLKGPSRRDKREESEK
jgi:hypothetical protein